MAAERVDFFSDVEYMQALLCEERCREDALEEEEENGRFDGKWH